MLGKFVFTIEKLGPFLRQSCSFWHETLLEIIIIIKRKCCSYIPKFYCNASPKWKCLLIPNLFNQQNIFLVFQVSKMFLKCWKKIQKKTNSTSRCSKWCWSICHTLQNTTKIHINESVIHYSFEGFIFITWYVAHKCLICVKNWHFSKCAIDQSIWTSCGCIKNYRVEVLLNELIIG